MRDKSTSQPASAPRTVPPPLAMSWLVKLRWALIVTQLLALAIAQLTQHTQLLWLWLGPFIGIAAASNLGLHQYTRSGRSLNDSQRVVGAALVLDALLFTGILATTGGASNPFTVMYLVQIVLAAVVLDSRWTTAVTALCATCFASLFALPAQAHAHHHRAGSGAFSDHLVGMWLAFALAAGIIAYYVRRIALMREQQQRQMEYLRARGEGAARMASLTTLAAGAAHELRTPMGTIAIAAYESLKRETKGANGATPDEAADDLRLILREIERCQNILDGMGSRFSEESKTQRIDCHGLLAEVALRSEETAAGKAVLIQTEPSLGEAAVRVVQADLITALCAMVQNARSASPGDSPPELSIELSADWVDFVVVDHGAGMDASTLARATEPFFTTKETGRGMGLGLFLANTCAVSAGGELLLSSSPAEGTRAVLRLPRCREHTSKREPNRQPEAGPTAATG